MAKSLKVEVLSVDGFNKTLIRVIEQTHVGKNFGNMKGDLRKFKADSGIILASNKRPSRDSARLENAEAANTLWLNGTDTSKDGRSIAVPTSKVEAIIQAVEQYNFYYSVPQINARVRAKREAEALRNGFTEIVG